MNNTNINKWPKMRYQIFPGGSFITTTQRWGSLLPTHPKIKILFSEYLLKMSSLVNMIINPNRQL